MKKFSFLVIAAMIIAGTTASAQSKLSKFLKKASESEAVNSVVNTVVANNAVVTLPGNWSYTGVAVNVSSDNTLANVASSTVTSGIESKVSSYMQKLGLKSGSITYTFTTDSTFTCTFLGIPLSGTYSLKNSGSRVTMKYGNTLKYLSMSGDIAATTEGCEILFEANSFINFLKKALALVGKKSSETSSSTSGLSSIANSYKDMKMGFKLAKK